MTQYLVAIHHPDDYDPSAEDEAMSRDIDAPVGRRSRCARLGGPTEATERQ